VTTIRVSLGHKTVTATWAGLGLAWLAALPAALAAVPPGADPDRSAGAVLELPDDGFLAGTLAPRSVAAQPPATLLWKTPLFAKPIEFEAEAVSRVRFPRRSPVVRPADAWRCELEGGDMLVGGVQAIDDEHVSLIALDLAGEEVRLRRSAVVRMTRLAPDEIIVVPGGGNAWGAAPGGWAVAGGRPAARRVGATAHQPLDAPRRACYDIALSWNKRPDLVITCADDARAVRGGQPDGAADRDSFRLELTAGKLLAIRESKTAFIEQVAEVPGNARLLRVLVFVDRDRGRMAVVMPGPDETADRCAFDATLPPLSPIAGGFTIALRGGDVRIDSLRVTAWKEDEPRLTAAAGLVVVSAADGRVEVRDGNTTRSLPLAEASTLLVREAPPAAHDTGPSLRVILQDGSQVSGRLKAVTETGISFEAPALAESVDIRFDQLAELEPVATMVPPPQPGRMGMLEAVHGRLAGSLADLDGSTGVGWLARGAVRPVPFAATHERLSIHYVASPGDAGRGESQPAPPAAAIPPIVYLGTGEAVPCTVLGGNAAGLRVKTPDAADAMLPAAVLRAVVFVPSAPRRIQQQKLTRLLTLPRMQQADPPTHVLGLQAGDYLRGKLLAIDENVVRFEVLGMEKQFARDTVTHLIWLTPVAAEAHAGAAPPPAANGLPVEAVNNDGRRTKLRAQRVVGIRLVGNHDVLGTAGIDLSSCDRLSIGEASDATERGALPYSQWRLTPAKVPRSLSQTANAEEPSPAKPASAAAETDPVEQQRLAAAEAAALTGDRSCLEPLGELLNATSPAIRRRALALLRQLTGRQTRELNQGGDDSPEQRAAAVLRWRQWIAREGVFAELAFPRPVDPGIGKAVLGRTLYSIPERNLVIEVDDQGRETFRAEAKQAFACDLLANGHRLVADGNTLVEYDAVGRQVWSLPDLPQVPMSVRRLDNGNTLVAMDGLPNLGQVVEYDPDGGEVWRWNAPGLEPADAERLPNGNTLVALHGANRVIEIDDEGTEIWGIDVVDPLRVIRLANDTTLVVSGDLKKAWIFDAAGAEVRDLGAVIDAGMAADGGLLLLGHDGTVTLEAGNGLAAKDWHKVLDEMPSGSARASRR
jgi:hypothetical protein